VALAEESTARPSTTGSTTRSGILVAVICGCAVMFDGYDLSVFGTTIPALLAYEPWGLDAAEAGVIASYALMGMLVGTLVCGVATDLLGRRRMLLTSVTVFSVFMVGCALAPSAELFGLFRFLAGVGLGGLLPTAIALTVEFAPQHRRNLASALVSSSFSVGTIGAAVLGIWVLPAYGFRPMYLVGALPLLVLAPVAYRVLPESVSYLAGQGRIEEARRVAREYGLPEPSEPPAEDGGRPPARAALKVLLRRPLLGTAVVFAVASLIGQLFIYGLSTWLPQIMRSAGYPLGSALSFLATMSVGAIVGASALAWLADRVGPRRMALAGFVIGVLALVTLSLGPPTAVLYVAVFLAGVGANGTAVVLNGFIATWFPAGVRATALGSIMTVARLGGIFGPILGGLIAAAGVPVAWNFYAFLVPAAIGVLVVLLLPSRHLDGSPLGTH
jgi:AAHS family benzoate transporter-like MFS transporter